MLIPGPRMTDRLQARASWASAAPTRCSRSGFQLDAMAEAVGKQVAGSDPPSPTWSPSPGWARSPCGPSDTMIFGMPSRSIAVVYQNAEPLVSEAFSSRVSSVSSVSMSSVTGGSLHGCGEVFSVRRSLCGATAGLAPGTDPTTHRGYGPSGRTDPVSTGRVASRRLHRRPVASVALAGRYWPASDPPMPPTLKYLFNRTKMATGGIITTTATAMTEPQSVVFCWKKDCSPGAG